MSSGRTYTPAPAPASKATTCRNSARQCCTSVHCIDVFASICKGTGEFFACLCPVLTSFIYQKHHTLKTFFRARLLPSRPRRTPRRIQLPFASSRTNRQHRREGHTAWRRHAPSPAGADLRPPFLPSVSPAADIDRKREHSAVHRCSSGFGVVTRL